MFEQGRLVAGNLRAARVVIEAIAAANGADSFANHLRICAFQIRRRFIPLLIPPKQMREILFDKGQEDAP
jgi:hypothetical protein